MVSRMNWEIGRLPDRYQIGINDHFPVLIDRSGLFQFISDRPVAGGASSQQKSGADQKLRPVADGGNRFSASKKVPGGLQRLRLFSIQCRRYPLVVIRAIVHKVDAAVYRCANDADAQMLFHPGQANMPAADPDRRDFFPRVPTIRQTISCIAIWFEMVSL